MLTNIIKTQKKITSFSVVESSENLTEWCRDASFSIQSSGSLSSSRLANNK